MDARAGAVSLSVAPQARPKISLLGVLFSAALAHPPPIPVHEKTRLRERANAVVNDFAGVRRRIGAQLFVSRRFRLGV